MIRDLILFIEDIVNSIKKIESFLKGMSKEDFYKDELRQSAVLREFEVIGEAVKNLPVSFKERYDSIPWREFAGFRDVLSHAYFEITLKRVWNVIKDELPELEKKIKEILENEKKEQEKQKETRIKKDKI